MSEQWSLTIVKANLSSSYFVYTYLLLYACLRLLHLTVTQILYTMDVFNTAFGSCGYFNCHCQIPETTNFQAYTCVDL